MTLWAALLKPRPTVHDLTDLLEPGWTGGKLTLVEAPGGVVTLHANSLTRDEAGAGNVLLLMLPSRFRPVEHKYGDRTMRGSDVRVLNSGHVQITAPTTILDYASPTWVPRGGA